ncbi:MAG: hypothetical protein ABWX82_09625 [Leifsonia sp.]
MTTRLAALPAVAAIALLALSGCAAPSSDPSPSPSAAASTAPTVDADAPCDGVKVIVSVGDLDVKNDPSTTTCVSADAPTPAATALMAAEITTEGTDQYGDQVVCRVNGVPAADFTIPAPDGSAYTEKCESMPAAFAYWSLWVKPADGEWGYAQEGLGTLQLSPGDSLELLFTLNDEPASPDA